MGAQACRAGQDEPRRLDAGKQEMRSQRGKHRLLRLDTGSSTRLFSVCTCSHAFVGHPALWYGPEDM